MYLFSGRRKGSDIQVGMVMTTIKSQDDLNAHQTKINVITAKRKTLKVETVVNTVSHESDLISVMVTTIEFESGTIDRLIDDIKASPIADTLRTMVGKGKGA